MGFLNAALMPWMAVAGIPVVIHLLSRRRHRVIDWGAMRFLVDAAARQNRRIRIEEWLLLLIRTLLLAALVLAMTLPVWRSRFFSAFGRDPLEGIVVLDGSLSTRLLVGGQSNFERQTQFATSVLDRLRPKDSAMVMVAGVLPRWTTRAPVQISADSRRELRDHVERIEPIGGGLDMLGCLEEATAALTPEGRGPKVIVVITDGQAHGWRADEVEAWRGLAGQQDGSENSPRIRVVRVGERPGAWANGTVTEVRTDRPLVVVGESVRFRVTVANTGSERLAGRTLDLRIGKESVAAQVLPDLSPGQSTTATMEHVFAGAGSHVVRFGLTGSDSLPGDDAVEWAVEVLPSLPVLVVDGHVSPGPLEGESSYLRMALGGNDQSEPLWQIEVLEPEELANAELGKYYAVVLANVARLPEGVARKLTDYVRSGGGLLVAAGDRIEKAFYQQALFRSGQGVLPADLGEIAAARGEGDSREPFRVAPPSQHHPAMQLLSDTERLDLTNTLIDRHWLLQLPDQGRKTQVLFGLESGEPVAVEKAFGDGRVIQMGIPLTRSWSNLPVRAAYVVMMHEWLLHLAQGRANDWNVRAGQPLVAGIEAGIEAAKAEVARPDGRTDPVVGRPRGGRVLFHYTCPCGEPA